MRVFREFRIDRRRIQDGDEPPARIEDGRAGATESNVSGSKVLIKVHADGALLGDAGADTVRAFDALGPDAPGPRAPILELFRCRLIATVLQGNAVGVAQQDHVARLPNNRVEVIDLFLRNREHGAEWLTQVLELTFSQDIGSRSSGGFNVMLRKASTPGVHNSRFRVGFLSLDHARDEIRVRGLSPTIADSSSDRPRHERLGVKRGLYASHMNANVGVDDWLFLRFHSLAWATVRKKAKPLSPRLSLGATKTGLPEPTPANVDDLGSR